MPTVAEPQPTRMRSSATPLTIGATGVYALDLSSLQRSLLADLSQVLSRSVTGPGLPTAQSSLSGDGNSLFLPAGGLIPYYRVDLTLGDAAPLGDARSGPPVFVPNAIEVTSDGRLFGLDGTSAVFLIDPRTGERAILTK